MPKIAANLTMLFNEMPFIDRFAAAKAAGFLGVIISSHTISTRRCCASSSKLRADGRCCTIFQRETGRRARRGIAILPDRVGEFRDGVFQCHRLCQGARLRAAQCLVGIAPADADPRELNETLVGNLRFAASTLARETDQALVEPINTLDIFGFYLNGTEQAVQLICEVRSNNLFIQYDIYHMQIMEGDLARTMQNASPADRPYPARRQSRSP